MPSSPGGRQTARTPSSSLLVPPNQHGILKPEGEKAAYRTVPLSLEFAEKVRAFFEDTGFRQALAAPEGQPETAETAAYFAEVNTAISADGQIRCSGMNDRFGNGVNKGCSCRFIWKVFRRRQGGTTPDMIFHALQAFFPIKNRHLPSVRNKAIL